MLRVQKPRVIQIMTEVNNVSGGSKTIMGIMIKS